MSTSTESSPSGGSESPSRTSASEAVGSHPVESQNQPAIDPAPEQAEVWRLQHPELGELSVAVGAQEQLVARDAGFRAKGMDQDQVGMVFCRGDAVLGRASTVNGHRVGVCPGLDDDRGPDLEAQPLLLAVGGPRIVVETDWQDRRVTQIRFRDADQIADFQPPEGSWAARRLAGIEASPWKRVAYPLAAGLGKSGAAIAGIVLVPLLLRLLAPVGEWISRLLPDVDLPELHLPSLDLPDLNLPNLPELDLPFWAEFLLDWTKVWVPLVLAILFAVGAVRRARRAERTRRQWASTPDAPAAPADAAEAQLERTSVTPGIGVEPGK